MGANQVQRWVQKNLAHSQNRLWQKSTMKSAKITNGSKSDAIIPVVSSDKQPLARSKKVIHVHRGEVGMKNELHQKCFLAFYCIRPLVSDHLLLPPTITDGCTRYLRSIHVELALINYS